MSSWWTKSKSTNQSDFESFYAVYSPKLWGIILTAKLPISQSEQILANTFIKAWQQPDHCKPSEKYMLSWLIGLAHQDGLPLDCLQSSWQSNR